MTGDIKRYLDKADHALIVAKSEKSLTTTLMRK